MAKHKVTWLGDEDPSVQIIEQGGHSFTKGIPTDVEGDLGKFEGNPFFSTERNPEPVESKEPEPADDVGDGTELGAVKAELRARGIAFGPNSSLNTLRAKLAESE